MSNKYIIIVNGNSRSMIAISEEKLRSIPYFNARYFGSFSESQTPSNIIQFNYDSPYNDVNLAVSIILNSTTNRILNQLTSYITVINILSYLSIDFKTYILKDINNKVEYSKIEYNLGNENVKIYYSHITNGVVDYGEIYLSNINPYYINLIEYITTTNEFREILFPGYNRRLRDLEIMLTGHFNLLLHDIDYESDSIRYLFLLRSNMTNTISIKLINTNNANKLVSSLKVIPNIINIYNRHIKFYFNNIVISVNMNVDTLLLPGYIVQGSKIVDDNLGNEYFYQVEIKPSEFNIEDYIDRYVTNDSIDDSEIDFSIKYIFNDEVNISVLKYDMSNFLKQRTSRISDYDYRNINVTMIRD